LTAWSFAAVIGIALLGSACSTTATADTTATVGTVKYTIKDGESIPDSLTGKAGDAENGRKVAIDRRKGNCLACHVLPIPEQPFHGEVGPDLSDVGARLSEGELRLRVVDPKVVNEDTIMPAFFKQDGFHRVLKNFQGKTIISAQDVEDVVAYLVTLR
jgi:sulfur-oxidizing protein SoxX